MIQSLQDKISSGYSTFDPKVGGQFFIRKWGLKVSTMWKAKYKNKKTIVSVRGKDKIDNFQKKQ